MLIFENSKLTIKNSKNDHDLESIPNQSFICETRKRNIIIITERWVNVILNDGNYIHV